MSYGIQETNTTEETAEESWAATLPAKPAEDNADHTGPSAPGKNVIVFGSDSNFGSEIVSRLSAAGMTVYPIAANGGQGLVLEKERLPEDMPKKIDVFISALETKNLQNMLGHMQDQTLPASMVVDRLNTGAIFIFTMPSGVPRSQKVAEWFRNGLANFRKTSGGYASAVVDPGSPGAASAVTAAAGVLDVEVSSGTHMFTLGSENAPLFVDTSSEDAFEQIDEVLASAASASRTAADASQKAALAVSEQREAQAVKQEALAEADKARLEHSSAALDLKAVQSELQTVKAELDATRRSLSKAKADEEVATAAAAAAAEIAAEHADLEEQVADWTRDRDELMAEYKKLTADIFGVEQKVVTERARLASLNERILDATKMTTAAEAAMVNSSATAERIMADAELASSEMNREALQQAEQTLEEARAKGQEVTEAATSQAEALIEAAELRITAIEATYEETRQAAEDLLNEATSSAEETRREATQTKEDASAAARSIVEEANAEAAAIVEAARNTAAGIISEATEESTELVGNAQTAAIETTAAAIEEAQRIISQLDIPAEHQNTTNAKAGKRRKGRR